REGSRPWAGALLASGAGPVRAPEGAGLSRCGAPSVRGSVGVEVAFEHLRERRHGLLGALALGAQGHLVALVRPEGQQHQDARGLDGLALALGDGDLCRLLTGGLGEERGRASVQPAGAGDRDGAFSHLEAFLDEVRPAYPCRPAPAGTPPAGPRGHPRVTGTYGYQRVSRQSTRTSGTCSSTRVKFWAVRQG